MSVTDSFRALAETIIDDLLEADPVTATQLGDHRFDDRLEDLSAGAVAERLTLLDDHVTALDAVDDVGLDAADAADLEILRARLLQTRFALDELRRFAWDPMAWNPGTALHLLVSREFAPAEERSASLRGRLGMIPDSLSHARQQLDDVSAIHVETAIAQLEGTAALIDGPVRDLASDDRLADTAKAAVTEFGDWLRTRLPDAHRSPRLGEHLYEAALWHALDDDVSAARLLADAFERLDVVGELLVEAATAYVGSSTGLADDDLVRAALEEVVRSAPVVDDTVLPTMEEALERTTTFVREHALVSLPSLDVRLIDMPEIHRGVAVAYCDAPGPLESAPVPTFVAVAPAPSDWDAERVRSFYREYNGIQLHDLMVHEAMPGHVLQLAHAQQLASATRVRRFGRSGAFVEGWAVYAEQLMADHGYSPQGEERSALALRLQQLKMQARVVINAILDISVHAHGMTEPEALALMMGRGFQEEGEAVGKWRRALLTSAQLPTYYAGYRAVSGIVADLRVLHPDWSDAQVHDLVLAHGSPAPRHLRTLLGI